MWRNEREVNSFRHQLGIRKYEINENAMKNIQVDFDCIFKSGINFK